MDTSKTITPQRILDATDAELMTLNPRHALALYRQFFIGEVYDWYESECGYSEPDDLYSRAAERMKAILAKMPHIPNKREGKLLRRLAAKRGR